MRKPRVLFAVAILMATGFDARASAAADPSVMEITVKVKRTSEYELGKKQIRRFDEATKISAALRIFDGLYGRWPKDLAELRDRTQGIDFALVGKDAALEPAGSDVKFAFSDGGTRREMLATPVDPAPAASQEQARLPGFRFKVKLEKEEKVGATARTPYDDPDSEEWNRLGRDATAAIAEALKAFPDAREAYFLTGVDEAGSSRFGLDVVFDGEADHAALQAATAAFARVAPADKSLQLVLLTPQALADLVKDSKLEPFYRRP